MSEDVIYKGQLIEVEKEEENINQKVWNILDDEQRVKILKNPDYYDNVLEILHVFDLYKKYVICNDKLYKIKECTKEDSNDIFYAKKDSEENIDFIVKFYNGGCSFNEAVEEALKDMEK